MATTQGTAMLHKITTDTRPGGAATVDLVWAEFSYKNLAWFVGMKCGDHRRVTEIKARSDRESDLDIARRAAREYRDDYRAYRLGVDL